MNDPRGDRAGGAAPPEDAEALVERIERDRLISRRAILGTAGRVLLAGAAYEVATLGLVGCAAYHRAFRARGEDAWSPAPLGEYDDGRWAGLQLGATTVESLGRYGFEGEVEYQADTGRIELIPTRRGPASPARVVLVFRDPETGRFSLGRDSVVSRVELAYPNRGDAGAMVERAAEAFGRGEVVHHGTQGRFDRTYLLYRDHRALCQVGDRAGGPLWVVFYEAGFLQPLAERLELCSVQCTVCTSSCTACTEQCTALCTAACTGCTEQCTAGCTSSCTSCTDCTASCTASCTSGCTGSCTDCTGSCTSGCTTCTSCTSMTSCAGETSCGSCTGCTSCTAGCTSGCTGSCTSCTDSCTSGCTSCTSGCTQCTSCTSCTSGCTTCTSCTERCTGCTFCTACTEGCTQRTGRLDGG